ncbi:cation:proton antiporter [Nannocystaceae bacterium ST9]
MPSLLDPLPRFIAQILAIVLVARLIGLLARRFGQPMVIAEISAGILLGPSVLGWLLPEVSAALFAPDSLVLLQVVSNLGLILFMFLVGLEFDPSSSRGREHAAWIVASATFVVPLGLGLLLALHLYGEIGEPGVFLAAVLCTTAFPVLARILAERRLLRSRLGAVTITAAAIDDVLAWCLLAFVVGSARAKGLAEAALTSALAIVYVALMILVVRPLLVRLAKRVTSSAELGHDRIAAIMLLLLASSGATELIGIHALFGAFLLGAILPRDGGLAHALVDKLEDLVVVVLLPLFFAYSGVRTQIGLLDSAESWITCALIIVVACVGKFGAGALAARLGGLTWRESTALGILMNARGLIVLIMLNIGLDLGLIDPTSFTMLVIMALFTTFVATPVLDAVHPIGQHVADLLAGSRSSPASPEPSDEPSPAPAFTLLLCADERPGRGLLALATTLADIHPNTRLHALQLRRPDAPEPSAAIGLDANVKQMSFVSSEPARDICRVADVKAADLVVLERGRPQGRELVGPTAERVLLDCRSDVAVLFDAGLDRLARVLVLAGASERDRAALALAERLREAGIELVRASPDELGRLARRRFDLVVLAFDELAESARERLDACLDLHARGTSLLLVRSRSIPEPARTSLSRTASTRA